MELFHGIFLPNTDKRVLKTIQDLQNVFTYSHGLADRQIRGAILSLLLTEK